MSLTNFPPQSKVPGHVYSVKEHVLNKDLTQLSRRELLDLKKRQSKLLENKSRLQKLPDKGQKIQDLYDRAVKALELKQEIDDASNLLSTLNIGTTDMNNLEWAEKSKGPTQQEVLDSDDDEDPLAILTSSNSVNNNKIIVKQQREDDQLITENDIKEAREVATATLHLDPVLEHVCQNENMEQSKRFLPHKPKFNSSSTLSLIELEGKKKIRDNTAATPPVLIQGTKLLTLRESIETEHIYYQKMKELQEKQASERLASKVKELGENFQQESIGQPKTDSSFLNKYRLPSSTIDEYDGEENEDSISDGEEDED